MTEPFAARARLDRQRTEAIAAQALADEQEAVVRRLQDAIRDGDERASQEQLAAAATAHAELTRRADELLGFLATDQDALNQALGAGAALFPDHNTDPIALLPVRVETIWWEPSVLRVRVYPDDILMSQFDPELTPDEADAAAAYWRTPGPDAWQQVLVRLRPARAAWAVRASRPGASPPVVRALDPAERRVTTVAMPKRWRFVGLNDGEVVVDKLGRLVPDPLPAGLLREEDGWETDWFSALKSGMGVELVFSDGVDHLDELLVLGVREESATAGAQRLRDLLLGHAFGGGLGLLPAGTPTNNTPRARSGWSSAPAFPAPDPGDPASGERPVADALAAALALPDADFLRDCSGAPDPEPAVVAALSLLTWPTLGKGFAEAAVGHLDLGTHQVRSFDPSRPWRAVRDHLVGHVRSRGPLPTVRVGRQPYGVLPTTSLEDWRPVGDRNVDGQLVPWLLALRERWRAALNDEGSEVPRVRPDQPVDQVAVDALSRVPVATGLSMHRMDGPDFAVPKTARDEQPTVFGLPGLAPDSVLRWSTQSDGYTDLGWGLDEATGVPRFVPRLAPDPTTFPARATATADYLAAARLFLAGELDAAGFDRDWPVELSSGRENPPRRSTFFDLPALDTPPDPDRDPVDATGLLDALLFLPNWSSLGGDDGSDDPVRQALAVTGDVEQLVADVIEGLAGVDRAARMAAAAANAAGLAQLEQAVRALTTVPVARLPELLLEVIDVYAHRVDAWVTSLASARLAALRDAGADGVRFGCYGWVRELRPPQAREEIELPGEDDTATVSPSDGYIHAPSLQHAATAAVLRSGFLGHPGEETFAVSLTSRRARIARWLLGGVRQGQNLGALLGYRFERALHDANLDEEIPTFRAKFPIQTVDEPPGGSSPDDLWSDSTEAIAARNVVDGMALARAGHLASQSATLPHQDLVGPIVDDVIGALDAVGDLVLAESVHQLVGGSPLRAGLAADTLGRGGEVPDTWYSLRTPHRARALTHRVAALLPEPAPTPAGAGGWALDAVAEVAPAVESWVAGLLGPPTAWTLSGVLGDGRPFKVTADQLGLGALSTVLEAAGGERARLGEAVRGVMQAAPGTPVNFSGADWRGLRGLAVRLRALLVGAQPVLPAHLPGEPSDVTVDVAAARSRLADFARTATGLPGAAELTAAAEAAAGPGGAQGWLSAARAALAEVLGTDVPVLPALVGAAPTARADVPGADVTDWLRRHAQVRPVTRALHETLTLSAVRTGRGEPLRAAQHPTGDDIWIGGTFPIDHRPAASTHLVWHAPATAPPGAPVTGLLLDEWVELLPGSDQPAAIPAGPPTATELTGVAFHYDRPDAKAPHAVLVAVPPDLDRGWTSDGLLQVLRETMELATMRAVDVGDVPRSRDLLPAIRISPDHATGRFLSQIETRRPNTDPAGPFRLEPGYRTDQVEAGLTARVHDPLWLLTRQWQFGEFAAQDAGSPAVVRMAGGSAPIDAWRPLGATDWVPYQLNNGPLNAQIEDEPVLVDERLRAEGGAQLLRLLDDADMLSSATAALAPHLLPSGDPDGSIVDLLGGRVPDAAAVSTALDAGTFDPDPALAGITGRWRAWWAAELAGRGPDCFNPHRFEHSAEVSTAGAVLRASEYLGDGLDWYSFDVVPGDDDGGPAPAAAPPGPRRPFVEEALPSTVSYGGLPADRFWEMEDARVDLGSADVSALDTGRLLLISFATVYGNDWFLVPLEVPVGSLTTLDGLLVRDVFGRNHLIERAGSEDPHWSMFTLHSPDPAQPAASGLLVLPGERGEVGGPLELLGLARDELANLAWAVQHRYTDGRGEAVDRRDRWTAIAPDPVPPGGLPAYGVQTVVPDYWFPLVPEAERPDAIRFRLAELTGPGLASRLEGRLVEDGLWVYEEEVPRDGAGVTRRPVLARWFDGSWHAWVRREKAPGTGESSSGLAFDTVRPTEPWPG
jgi:hypothetical protein